MVVDNKNVLCNALKKIVPGGKAASGQQQTVTVKSTYNVNSTVNKNDESSDSADAQEVKCFIKRPSVKIKKETAVYIDLNDPNDFDYEQNLRKKMAQRKRVVSECASVIADPTQATGQPPGCLRWRRWLPTALRLPCLILCLYIFICSLEMLSTSFRLMAGKTAGTIFQDNPLLQNPIVGLMLGVLFTVLVQSSSTCTSVIVSMVSSGILEVQYAIPMIMGANIGTSLTNTLVSFSQVADRDQFERAFAGATVHDCFNWLSVSVLLSFEVCTGYMYHLTSWLTEHLQIAGGSETASSLSNVNLLGTITKPLTKKIVQIDKSVLKCWALGGCNEERLLKVYCNKKDHNITQQMVMDGSEAEADTRCGFLLNFDSVPDFYIGLIVFLISFSCLTVCLLLIVKLLNSLLKGAVADLAKKTINAEIPGAPWLSGYICIVVGALLTFLVQSSSVFTSTITPLVGLGVISVDRMYPLTLGSNIGTTTTAMLASLSAEPNMLRPSLQIALCHLAFNFHGILLFYPVPAMRLPLNMCKILGRTTANYRWFAIVYLLTMFGVVPAFVLSLSVAGPIVLASTIIPLILFVVAIIIINVLQDAKPSVLPGFLRSWSWLPLCLHSLDPYDRIINSYCCFGAKYTAMGNRDASPDLNVITTH